jgi:hypothetical protein
MTLPQRSTSTASSWRPRGRALPARQARQGPHAFRGGEVLPRLRRHQAGRRRCGGDPLRADQHLRSRRAGITPGATGTPPIAALDAIFAGNRRYHRYREAHRGLPARARLRSLKDRDRARRAPPDPCLQRLPLLGLHGEDRDPRHRRQGRVRDHLLRLRRERPHPQDQGVLRPGFARRPLRRHHGIPRLRDARRRIQGDGHGALRRPERATTSRAWRNSRTASWSSTPTTPT